MKTEVLEEKPSPVPLCSPQIPSYMGSDPEWHSGKAVINFNGLYLIYCSSVNIYRRFGRTCSLNLQDRNSRFLGNFITNLLHYKTSPHKPVVLKYVCTEGLAFRNSSLILFLLASKSVTLQLNVKYSFKSRWRRNWSQVCDIIRKSLAIYERITAWTWEWIVETCSCPISKNYPRIPRPGGHQP
jgi:hypothetical protein